MSARIEVQLELPLFEDRVTAFCDQKAVHRPHDHGRRYACPGYDDERCRIEGTHPPHGWWRAGGDNPHWCAS